MHALVTGATGFVGANVAAALAERGIRVRILRRPGSRLDALEDIEVEEANGDLLDADSLAKAMRGCQWVFHVAGMSQYWRSTRERIYQVNVDGTRNVMNAAVEAGVERAVITSSIAALGFPENGALLDESSTFPQALSWWAYGHSKHLAEQEAFKAGDRLEVVVVNPAIVLGPRDINFVSGSLVRGSVKGQLRVVPPGGSSVVHVADVVAGHLAAAERGRPGERYILGGENLSHYEMARTLAVVTGGPPPRLVLPRPLLGPITALVDGFNRLKSGPPVVTGEQVRLGGETFYVDCGKAVRELGLPQTPFRKAAEDAFRWYEDRGLL